MSACGGLFSGTWTASQYVHVDKLILLPLANIIYLSSLSGVWGLMNPFLIHDTMMLGPSSYR